MHSNAHFHNLLTQGPLFYRYPVLYNTVYGTRIQMADWPDSANRLPEQFFLSYVSGLVPGWLIKEPPYMGALDGHKYPFYPQFPPDVQGT